MKSDLEDEQLAEEIEQKFVRQHDENIQIVSSTQAAEEVVAETILDPVKKKLLEEKLAAAKQALSVIEKRLEAQKEEAKLAAQLKLEVEAMGLFEKLSLVERINLKLIENGQYFGDAKKLVDECYLKILKLVDHSL